MSHRKNPIPTPVRRGRGSLATLGRVCALGDIVETSAGVLQKAQDARVVNAYDFENARFEQAQLSARLTAYGMLDGV